MPSADGFCDLDDKIAVLLDLEQEVEKIQACIDTIPQDTRRCILNNILCSMPHPRNEYAQLVPSLSVWKREKRKFITRRAKTLWIYGYNRIKRAE